MRTLDEMGGTSARPTRVVEHPAPRRRHRDGPTVSWYGRLLIVGTLLLAAGWEIFRLLLTIITLD
ncbi:MULTISPECIES: hypothetical protein [unclassified Bradyrhizobium]|jgi:hypothetical protein|uniref:hypothetical protein n=1 Tax=unclassified Bradyrhizobium TaxID=2631580 RepID=UPI0004A5FBF7|nr:MULTISPECIES: hypothetical protein [unclassified Bradyrhizobium]OCX29130.1 hypothetical protein QU42_19540 [Bradyrhizobium sp. UASWS1016]